MTQNPMQVEVEDVSPIKRRLAIVVPQEEVSREVDRAYRELGKRAKVKGFRPGKIPRSVLELYYKKDMDQEVSDNLVRRAIGEACKEKGLDAVGLNWPEPPPTAAAGQDYRFTVEVEVTPEFTVENYRGLKLNDPGAEVADSEVEARLEEIRESNAMLQPAAEDRGIKEGDFVVLDYQGHFAGDALAEAKGENVYLEVGAGKFNKDFELNLVGLTPGGDARFAVDLPPDFFNPLLAGKVLEFEVKVHDIKEKVTPAADDAFAQSLGGNFQTLADLREAIRVDIIKGKERERQANLEQQVLDQLLATHTFEVPPSLIRQEQESLFREQMGRLQQMGVNIEGLDHEKMFEASRGRAETRVKSRLLLERLAAQEGVEVDDAEVDARLQKSADASGRTFNQLKEFYLEHNLLEALRRQIRDEKTVQLIINQADLGAGAAAAVQENS